MYSVIAQAPQSDCSDAGNFRFVGRRNVKLDILEVWSWSFESCENRESENAKDFESLKFEILKY